MPPVKKIKAAKPVKEALTVEDSPVVSGQLQKKLKKKQQKVEKERGVLFIKHLPHGFFEDQLKNYFQQFGTVTRLRLVRSKRTGGSKGFAFVEFEYPEVAQVAAETMDNYLMFQRVVKAAYIPPEKQRFNYFKSTLRKVKNKAGKEIYVSGKILATQRKVKKQNDWSENAYQKRTEAKLKKLKKLDEKYKHLGIDFSSILVEPKKLTAVEKAEQEKLNSSEEQPKKALVSQKKRKNEAGPTTSSKVQKKSKKDIQLEDLLGNTLNEDPEDGDWVLENQSEDTSDEESYGMLKTSDDDADEDVDEDDDGDEDESENESDAGVSQIKKNKKPLKNFSKSTTVNKLDQLIKRKPHLGGIQKPNKKVVKPTVTKAKKSMQAMVVKEMAKPKSKFQSKPKQKTTMGRKLKV